MWKQKKKPTDIFVLMESRRRHRHRNIREYSATTNYIPETQTTCTCSHYIKLKRNAPTSRVEPKRSKHAATIKIHRAERRQSFQKILRLDKSAFLVYASTNTCAYASTTTSTNRSRKFYPSTKVHSSLTHQQTTTIDQAIPETL
ncbi:uncharacterized protein LOC143913868 [Arctopsyche grandis]|uniref:uncharacterized protein LOC143913868 n=1 Tax=Arctopsyche grandis TaxID=121162 RepID=UPI00406D9A42